MNHPTPCNNLIKLILFCTLDPTRVNKNTNYVLCKPASHATNMELKYKKSPGEYEGNITKPSYTTKQKVFLPKRKLPIIILYINQFYRDTFCTLIIIYIVENRKIYTLSIKHTHYIFILNNLFVLLFTCLFCNRRDT